MGPVCGLDRFSKSSVHRGKLTQIYIYLLCLYLWIFILFFSLCLVFLTANGIGGAINIPPAAVVIDLAILMVSWVG